MISSFPADPLAARTGPLRFGPDGRFELRPAARQLLIDGRSTSLGGRAFDLLMALATRPDELLSKVALMDIVWPGRVVEENNLRVQVNTLRRLLGEGAIVTVPGRGYRLTLAVQALATAVPATPLDTVDTVAAVGEATPVLFGRAHDLARLASLLGGGGGGGGCVTLVGLAGVGKSSLARQAAARWGHRSAWVDLAMLTDGRQMAGAIARALGGQLEEGEATAQLPGLVVEGPPLLLVLDNAEHLIEDCAAAVVRLRAVPCLRLLVTSVLPLALDGEQVLRLAPLDVGIETDVNDGAMALLLARIAEADRRFQPTPAALRLLGAVCRQLDGLPLALEMAAARVPLMGVQAVHDALAERFALLSRGRRDTPARHRTLHDALEWSHGLLGPAEQRLFRALGLFAGGFTLDLAVSLASSGQVRRWDVVDGLAVLVEHSLVTVSGEDPPRYRLLESLRALALEKLAMDASQSSRDEGFAWRLRHAQALLALFSGVDTRARCLAEMDNAREAFLWAREHALSLAAGLSAHAALEAGFTTWRQEVTEWMLSLQPAMEQPAGRALPRRVQAHWWSNLSYVLNLRRAPAARSAALTAVTLWRGLDDPDKLQGALANHVRAIREPCEELDLACAELLRSVQDGAATPRALMRVNGALAEAARLRGDAAALLACREQELQMARLLSQSTMGQAAESNVCVALLELGRHAEAAERAQALLEHIDEDGCDENGNLPWALNVCIEAWVHLGQLDAARALLPRSLAASRRFGTTVAWQGTLLLMQGERRFEAAGRLAGHVKQLLSARGSSPDRDELARLAQVEATVQLALGAAVAATLAAQGRSLGEAAAQALAVSPA